MKYSKITMSVLLALGIQAQAQAVDLLETYHAAQGQDAVFASARASQQAGREKLTQGRATMLPSVNLTANSTYYDNQIDFPTASRQMNYNSSGIGVTLVQPLFRQQNWLAYTESELQVAISDAQFHLAEQDLIVRVAQAYFDVLISQDSVQLAEAQKKAIAEQLEQARRNFEVGTATITDTYEAQARFDLTNAQLIAAQSNLEIKRRSLQQIANANTGELKLISAELKLDAPQPADVSKWVDDAQQRNLQVVIAQAGAELADKEVARNRGGHYPTLDLVANVSKSTANGGTFNGTGYGPSDTTSKSVGVQFNMPLFQGGATQSKWREAEANRDKAQQDMENARRSVGVQVRQAYLGVVSGIAQVQALQQALKSSESLLQASKLGQNVGVRTSLDVLNAQQQLFSTRRDLYQAQYNYLVSQLRLKAAAGNLTEADLARVNQALR
ncbi:MAG: type I secretion outer membrane protein TolC [Gallionellaceae bacterium]|nr:MAG: type I secretion outer membrane protein TolC [Gallionellaceae bacterium]